MTLKEIVEQLEVCKFRDEIGHPLENNVAFVELKQKAEEEAEQTDAKSDDMRFPNADDIYE